MRREGGDMSFNLYFAGATTKDTLLSKWFETSYALRLFTQVTDRSTINEWIKKEDSPLIFLDSGAWAAHSRKVRLDVDDYITYSNSRVITFCSCE